MRRRRLTAVLAIAIVARVIAPSAAATAEPEVCTTATPLLDVAAAIGSLAVSANGQTVFLIDVARGAVVSVDSFDPTRRREVVAPPAAGEGRPVAIGCLPGDVLAVVCRGGDTWELRTHRIRPGEAADPGRPEARVPLGVAAGAGDRVSVAVSRSRDWLAIAALPAPLPPVVRGVFAGAGVRLLPPGDAAPDDARPVAATVSPADELVLFEAVGDGPARVAFLTPSGRPLLRMETGLSAVRSSTFSRRDGRLWVVAGGGSGAARLWRLDAVMRGAGQAVRPVPVAGPVDPRAVVDVPGESLVVADGGPRPSLQRIDVDMKEKP